MVRRGAPREPDRLVADRAPGLLERDRELAVIQTALDEAAMGGGAAVVIEGPPGVGKTALLGEARREAVERRMAALVARGSELEREFAFGVVRQLFEPVLERADVAERGEVLAGAAAHAAALFDPTAPHPVPGDDREAAFRTFHGLYWLTANLAHRRPVAVLVDDVHWADGPSGGFLTFLARRLHGLPIALLVASRTAEPGADREVVDRLAAEVGVHVLRPPPLSPEASGRLVRGALVDPSVEFAAACHEATGGNPFLLRELLRSVLDEGIAGDRDGAARVAELAPRAVSRSVLIRLSRLPDEAVSLARAVAVLGDRADPRVAAALAGLDRETARRGLDLLSAAGILCDAQPLSFVHPLIRSAVYADLPAGMRGRLHEAAAWQLQADGARPELLAAHLLHVEPAGDSRVVAVLRRASAAALARGAARTATAYLRRALAEPPAGEELGAVSRELTAASVRAGVLRPDSAASLERTIELTRDPLELAASARDLAYGLFAVGQVPRGLDLIRRAIDAVQTLDRDLALRLEADFYLLSELTQHDLEQARERVVGYAGLAGSTPGEALVLAAAAGARSYRDPVPGPSLELVARAVASGQLFSKETAGSLAALMAVSAADRGERFDLVEWMHAGLEARAKDAGTIAELIQVTLSGSWLSLVRGRVADAEADARRALELGEAGGLVEEVLGAGAPLADALREAGRADEAEGVLHARGLMGDLPPIPALSSGVLWSRGCLHLVRGRFEAALSDFEAQAAMLEGVGMVCPAKVPPGTGAALALIALGRGAEARQRAAHDVEIARRWGTPIHLGMTLRGLGLAEEGDRRVEALADAVAVLEPTEGALELARTLVDLGAAHRRAGRRREARPSLRRALELAVPGGAEAIAARARSELAATGERVRRVSRDRGPSSLTPSERRVADLAAEGHGNREIAQMLFLTVKTVETHLSSAYRKLGISGRGDLRSVLGG